MDERGKLVSIVNFTGLPNDPDKKPSEPNGSMVGNFFKATGAMLLLGVLISIPVGVVCLVVWGLGALIH